MSKISEILSQPNKPALFVGNGINQFKGSSYSSWKDLLGKLAQNYQLSLSQEEMDEMSNTEFFDILDLARPQKDRSSLQRKFCDLMNFWEPSDHHATIVGWAKRHNTPIITVNFDENLSKSINAKYFVGKGFTQWYPWSSYFASQQIADPRHSFAIWHAHGMMRYSQSIRLGLTHYMGAVQRARPWVYTGHKALRANGNPNDSEWTGRNTWLDILFFSPLMIFGFGFSKDETFLRWLFLERARLQKINPDLEADTWFIDTPKNGSLHRKPFFESLGIEYVTVSEFADIYGDPMWQS